MHTQTFTQAAVLLLLLAACTSPAAHDNVPADCPEHPLRAEARREQMLAVIVTLETAWVAESTLSAVQAAEQRRRIAALQDQLLDELTTTSAQLVRRYDTLPMIAVRTDEIALCRMLRSSAVRSVQRDSEVPPTTGS